MFVNAHAWDTHACEQPEAEPVGAAGAEDPGMRPH